MRLLDNWGIAGRGSMSLLEVWFFVVESVSDWLLQCHRRVFRPYFTTPPAARLVSKGAVRLVTPSRRSRVEAFAGWAASFRASR
jgi:hypothetical protein